MSRRSYTVRRAMRVLERLPPEALGVIVERLIGRLDAAEPDPDLEPEEDCCEAEEADFPARWRSAAV